MFLIFKNLSVDSPGCCEQRGSNRGCASIAVACWLGPSSTRIQEWYRWIHVLLLGFCRPLTVVFIIATKAYIPTSNVWYLVPTLTAFAPFSWISIFSYSDDFFTRSMAAASSLPSYPEALLYLFFSCLKIPRAPASQAVKENSPRRSSDRPVRGQQGSCTAAHCH